MVTVFGVIAPPGGDGRALSRPLLLWGARALWGLEALPPLARGENGKPFFPSAPHLQFNLSHSGAVALCALSTRGSVGVDVEEIRPRNPALPRRVLHPLEYAAYEAAGGTWEAFYDLWTRKEAWVKYQGGRVWNARAIAPPAVPCRGYALAGCRAAVCAAAPLPEAIRLLTPEDLPLSE